MDVIGLNFITKKVCSQTMLICDIVQYRVAEYSFADIPDLLRISSLDVSIL